MSKQPTIRNLDDLLQALEGLRSHLMDLEAMAHAAAEALEHLPYLPRRPYSRDHAAGAGIPTVTEEARRHMGRMQSMVVSTAATATRLLERIEVVVEQVELAARADSSDDDASDGGAHEPRVRYGSRYEYLPNGGASVIRAHSASYRLPSDAAPRPQVS